MYLPKLLAIASIAVLLGQPAPVLAASGISPKTPQPAPYTTSFSNSQEEGGEAGSLRDTTSKTPEGPSSPDSGCTADSSSYETTDEGEPAEATPQPPAAPQDKEDPSRPHGEVSSEIPMDSDASVIGKPPAHIEIHKPGWFLSPQGWEYWQADGTRLKKTWLETGGARYYLGENGIALTGVQNIDGTMYFFASDAKMTTGWSWDKANACWHHAKSNGALTKGWLWDNAWYLLDDSYAMVTDAWVKDAGEWYSFASNGAMRTATWYQDADGWHYLNKSGEAITGWYDCWAGTFHFASNDGTHNAALVGLQRVGGKDYFFDAQSGAKKNTWIDMGKSGKGFANSKGIIGPQRLRDGVLWLDSETKASGLTRVDTMTFYANPSTGVLESGWKTVNSDKYYFDPTSKMMKTGWLNEGGSWYWLDKETGAMKTGWLLEGGSWYWLQATGKMAVDWQFIEGHWYYFTPSNGKMHTGVLQQNGKYYFFGTNGQMIDINAKYPDMFYKAQNYSSQTSWLLLVDSKGCRTGIFYGRQGGWSPIHEWSCCTGAPETPTPLGQYTVTGKGYSFGRGYTCYYYTQFYGDYLFHSVLYRQGTFNILDGRLGMRISHGCIRLPLECAKWIYDNIPYRTKVVIF